MKIHKCYFCNFESRNLTDLKRHILKKTKCSYLLRTSNIKIESIDDYYKYVELHIKEPDSDIWGLDYDKIKQNDYYSSSDDNDDDNPLYTEFMNKMVHNKTYNCEYCSKKFNRKDNLKRHYKSCKKNKIKPENDIQSKILFLQQQLNDLQNGNISNCNTDNSIRDSYNTNNTNNYITNNHINNAVILKLNNFGDENKEIFLDEEYLLKWFKQPFSAIPNMVEKLHFAPNKRPENTNIRINNISNGKIQIFKKEWKTKIKKTVVKDLIKNLGEELIEKYEDFIEENKIKKADYSDFHKFRAKFDAYYDDNSFGELDQEIDFMKDQEQQVDCKLIDCCNKHKDYLKNL